MAGCDRAWKKQEDRNLCYRVASSGESLASLLAALGKQAVPSLDTPDSREVANSVAAHPKAQCRLDTYFSGSLCPVNFDPMIIPGRNSPYGQNSAEVEQETLGSFCHSGLGFLEGNRPRCWFKPKVGFLLIAEHDLALKEASGNGNGVIEPNERFTIIPSFKNKAADKSVSTIRSWLTSNNREVVMEQFEMVLPGMQPGEIVTHSGGFIGKITQGSACGSLIEYQIMVESPEGNASFPHSFNLGSRELMEGGSKASGEAIPDGVPTGLSSIITIDSEVMVSSARVRVDLSHPYTSDISIDLVNPAGAMFRVFSRKAGKDINTEFNLPVSGLAKGDWKLLIVDNGKRDQGILNSWALSFEYYKCIP